MESPMNDSWSREPQELELENLTQLLKNSSVSREKNK